MYYASNDSFLLRTGVDCDVSIQILCHALAFKYCGTLYKIHPKKSVAAIQKKTIVELYYRYMEYIRLHHLSNLRINRGLKVTHDLVQIERKTMIKSGCNTLTHNKAVHRINARQTCE